MFDVIIPAYNAETTIADAVKSAEHAGASTIFVVDDGSGDGTSAVATALGATVIRQRNQGASRARQHGAELSSAEFIVFLDADDQVITAGIKASLAALHANPTLVAAGGAVKGVMPNKQIRDVKRTYSGTFGPEKLVLQGYGAWPPGAAVLRRSAYWASRELEIPGLSTRYAEDYEMLIRLSMVGDIYAHEIPAVFYRMYDGKSSRASLAPLSDKEKIRAHYARVLGLAYKPPTTRQLKASAEYRNARQAWAHGRRGRAAFAICKGSILDPKGTATKAKSILRTVGLG